MDFNQLLAVEFDHAKNTLQENGYSIEEITYLNDPPGSLKIVRVQEVYPNKVKLIVTYHYDSLKQH